MDTYTLVTLLETHTLELPFNGHPPYRSIKLVQLQRGTIASVTVQFIRTSIITHFLTTGLLWNSVMEWGDHSRHRSDINMVVCVVLVEVYTAVLLGLSHISVTARWE